MSFGSGYSAAQWWPPLPSHGFAVDNDRYLTSCVVDSAFRILTRWTSLASLCIPAKRQKTTDFARTFGHDKIGLMPILPIEAIPDLPEIGHELIREHTAPQFATSCRIALRSYGIHAYFLRLMCVIQCVPPKNSTANFSTIAGS